MLIIALPDICDLETNAPVKRIAQSKISFISSINKFSNYGDILEIVAVTSNGEKVRFFYMYVMAII